MTTKKLKFSLFLGDTFKLIDLIFLYDSRSSHKLKFEYQGHWVKVKVIEAKKSNVQYKGWNGQEL